MIYNMERLTNRIKRREYDGYLLGSGIVESAYVTEDRETKQNNGWISIDERLPDTDDFILLSFSNFTNPLVGRYETDEDGSGAFYIGDELETCLSQNIFVNAWQPLPEPFKED